MQCERLSLVDAYRQGRLPAADAASFERHLKACEACRTRHREDDDLGRLMRASGDAVEVDDLRVRRVWAKVLHESATPRASASRRSIGFGAALGAAGLVALGVVVVEKRVAPPELAGEVRAEPGAVFHQERRGSVERVTVSSGTVHVHVRKQKSGERFLVEVPDGELEVRGTTFDVDVEGGHTQRVAVTEGLVAVRLQGQGEVLRGAGESWPVPASPPVVPPLASPPPVAVTALPASPSSHRAPAVDHTRESEEYAAAVTSYRSGHYDESAEGLRRFVAAHPGSPLTEDATYLEAVSLAAAGREDGAAAVAADHLARFPASFHAKEASVLVARAARDRGDCVAARRVLARWSSERGGEVERALAGCDAR